MEQTRIGEPAEPITWDGEPLFSPSTVAERRAQNVGLFSSEAFEQLPGQMSMPADDEIIGAADSEASVSGCSQ